MEENSDGNKSRPTHQLADQPSPPVYFSVNSAAPPGTDFGQTRIWTWLSAWGSVVFYCAFIFLLSSQPDLQPPSVLRSNDKLGHMVLYSGLGWLWARGMCRSRPGSTIMTLTLSTFIFSGLYGLSDEWHQSYVPGRYADFRDVVADVSGGMLGGVIYLSLCRRRPKVRTHRTNE